MKQQNYLVCAMHPWNQKLFELRTPQLPGIWRMVSRRDELSVDMLADFRPRYAFFLHWSWIVPREILSAVEAVCFHMTDLPFGHGGSPLQNLIQRGHSTTMLSALRMTEQIDAGPIYMKSPLNLDGRAQDIYERASALAFDMIEQIIIQNPDPQPQIGEPTLFRRRTPAESRLPTDGDLTGLYDHIRMLDAEGYPKAFVQQGPFTIEFGNATMVGEAITAIVKITRRKIDD